jgi:predicted glycosyltransferase involved in capsule biosynthesis
MDVQIVIPVRIRPEHPLRRRNLWVCLDQASRAQAWLRGRHRTVEVTLAEHDSEARTLLEAEHFHARHVLVPDGGPFSKSRAANAGAAVGKAPLICLLDGDCWIGADWLERCLELIGGWQQTKVWRGAMLPYQRFHFLTPRPSAEVAAGAIPILSMRHEACPSVGGAVWVERKLWRQIGGWDEGFTGWGPDDRDFAYRLAVGMKAPLLRGDLPLWHLFHEEQDKSTDPDGWRRFRANQKRLGSIPAGD